MQVSRRDDRRRQKICLRQILKCHPDAAHIKNVRGRKTDVNDATWLADLMGRGLIRGSFAPDARTRSVHSAANQQSNLRSSEAVMPSGFGRR
jgi:hypothetical protein